MGLDFYHHMCNTCLTVPEKLSGELRKFQWCSSCKLVSYCGRPHQKDDWREHKHFCREVHKLLEERRWTSLFLCLEEPSPQKLYEHQQRLIHSLEYRLNRPLTLSERSMIYYPDICGLCLKPNGSEFISCSKCRVQFYCSREHMAEHSEVHDKDCDGLRFGFELNSFLSKNVNRPPNKLRQVTVPKSEAFPSSLLQYFNNYLDVRDASIFDRVIFGDVASYLLTLVWGMRECPDIRNKSSIKIFILGASEVENYILSLLDIFFTWLPEVETLNLAFVGPDCHPPVDEFIEDVKYKHADKNLMITYHSGMLYHELFLTGKEIQRPDVLAAFNCGFHEFRGQKSDTWQETLDFILTQKDILLIATSYTYKEAVEDSQPFEKNGELEVLKWCEHNPFRSLNPYRNPERSESAVFYFNQYVSVYRIK